MTTPSGSQRACVFTIPGEDFPGWCATFKYDDVKTDIKYMVIGWELSSHNIWHGQGYAEFHEKHRYKKMQEIIGSKNSHIEWRKGARIQAREYCMETKERHEQGLCYNDNKCKTKQSEEKRENRWKTHHFIEFGVWEAGGQGKRTDITSLKELIKTGASKLEIMETNDAAWRLNRSLDEYRLLVENKTRKEQGFIKKDVRVYWGPPGSGKTKRAHAECPKAFVLRASTSGIWWDGYDGETEVIIDEFDGWVPWTQILSWLDGYACTIPIKGGMRSLMATTIILTSNKSPLEWYPGIAIKMGDVNGIQPLIRRITTTIHMDFIDAKYWTKESLELLGLSFKIGSRIEGTGRAWDVTDGFNPIKQAKSRLIISKPGVGETGL